MSEGRCCGRMANHGRSAPSRTSARPRGTHGTRSSAPVPRAPGRRAGRGPAPEHPARTDRCPSSGSPSSSDAMFRALRPDPRADLVQLFRCPLTHGRYLERRYHLRWRRTRETERAERFLTTPPEVPLLRWEHELPEPCVLHPEEVDTYPWAEGDTLPAALIARIDAWEDAQASEQGPGAANYQSDLSIPPGWRVGGFPSWASTGPMAVDCASCATPMRLLLTAGETRWTRTRTAGFRWRTVNRPCGEGVDPRPEPSVCRPTHTAPLRPGPGPARLHLPGRPRTPAPMGARLIRGRSFACGPLSEFRLTSTRWCDRMSDAVLTSERQSACRTPHRS